MCGPELADRLEIRALGAFDRVAFAAIADGYTSHERFDVLRRCDRHGATFQIELRTLEAPFHKEWPADHEIDALYETIMLRDGASLGCFAADGTLAAIAICERRAWNASLLVWEFRVAPSRRRQGVGRRLMQAVVDLAAEKGLASVVCETQNTNVPAVRFYQACGFELEGLDLAAYGPGIDEVMFTMRRRPGGDARPKRAAHAAICEEE